MNEQDHAIISGYGDEYGASWSTTYWPETSGD